jgi:hypothetical protein
VAQPKADLYIQAGSYEPVVWTITDPDTGLPLDLTAAGYSVAGVVATRTNGTGTVLIDLVDDEVWARTAEGEIFFQPPSAVSSEWPAVAAYYQAYLYHPSGQRVRFAQGRFVVDADLIED